MLKCHLVARGPKAVAVQTGESRQVRLHLASSVLAILDSEAEQMHMDAARFFRMLLRRRMGLQLVERSPDASTYSILTDASPNKEAFVVSLPATLHEFLQGTCNRLGGGAPSLVASDLILQWVDISPLDRACTIDIEQTVPVRRTGSRRRTGSQPTKVQLLSLADDVVALLHSEAAAMGIRHTELLRNLLRAKMGRAEFRRPHNAVAHEPLANRDHTKQAYRVHLPLDHVALINAISQRLGGGEKASIASHLILDFVGISPLRPPAVD